MSGFTAEAISALDFDFTGILNQDGSGPCTGKGVIPEPTEDRLKAFFAKVNEMRATPQDDFDLDKASAMLEEVRESIVAVGNGTPSLEELHQLPPRAFQAFNKWLLQELTDPKG